MYKCYFKRIIDFSFSLVGMFLLLPLLLVLFIIIYIDSSEPPLFKQERVGVNGEVFEIYKFRTMRISAPDRLPTSQLKNQDEYITRVGLLLRRLSLDELPQLFNIIKGDMSFIGPRPVVKEDIKLVNLRKEFCIEGVRPGISGLAQVSGRDDINDRIKADYDRKYAQNITFINDMKIFLKTIAVVFTGEGIKGLHKKSSLQNKSIELDELKSEYK